MRTLQRVSRQASAADPYAPLPTQVVPGSHARRSTAEEREVCVSGLAGDVDRVMPGGIEVRINPGDVAYFDAGILHRGWNPKGRSRWTIHNVTCAPLPVLPAAPFSLCFSRCLHGRATHCPLLDVIESSV